MLLLVTGTGALKIKAQNIVIKTKDGTDNVKQLSSLQNLTFSESYLLLNNVDGTNQSFSISTIRIIYFNSVTTGTENALNKGSDGKIYIYPNPAGDRIYIQNLSEGTSIVTIFRMDGIIVMQTEVSSDTKSVSISTLGKGIYLLRINNQVVKFIKL